MTTKYHTLQPWLDEILTSIKKDIKTDYLPADGTFYRANFGSRPLNRLTSEEINAAFVKELLVGNQGMDEWVVNRWVFKHGEVYRHFAERLSKISDDFTNIKMLTPAQSEEILAGAIESFGAKPVYFFSILNGVVFPEAVLSRLSKLAAEANTKQKEDETRAAEQLELSKILEKHQREVSRLTEKYESKLDGLLKKYTTDTEALKSQVRALQQKLNGQSR